MRESIKLANIKDRVMMARLAMSCKEANMQCAIAMQVSLEPFPSCLWSTRRARLLRLLGFRITPVSTIISISAANGVVSHVVLHQCYSSLQRPASRLPIAGIKEPYRQRPMISKECVLTSLWERPRNSHSYQLVSMKSLGRLLRRTSLVLHRHRSRNHHSRLIRSAM